MGVVFVNYRTRDNPLGAAGIHDMLARRFGDDRVFRDSVSITAGDRYPQKLREGLEQAEVLVAVIGPRWNKLTDEQGQLLIQHDGDWVRREIARAIERRIPIIPVLLLDTPENATPPDPAILPASISTLVEYQTFEVSQKRFGADLDRLADRLIELVPSLGTPDSIFSLPQAVGTWLLDEHGGGIARDTAGSHDGEASEVDWRASDGGAALFNGSHSEVATRGPVLETGPGSSYTVSAWVRIDRTPNWFATAVSQSADDVITFYLQYSWEDNRWAFSTQDQRALSFSPPALETWTHLVGVRRNTQLLLYVNGTEQRTVTTGFSKAESVHDSLFIGRALYCGEPGDWFPGSIKNVQVFNKALSTDQVKALHVQSGVVNLDLSRL